MNDTMLKLLYQIYNQIWSTAMPSKSITLQLLVRATSDQVDHDIRFFFPCKCTSILPTDEDVYHLWYDTYAMAYSTLVKNEIKAIGKAKNHGEWDIMIPIVYYII